MKSREIAKKIRVALLATPESTGSLLYGMYDLFASVGRDWAVLVDGTPRESPFEVRIVGRETGSLSVGNGLSVRVNGDFGERADIVCVPEVGIAPYEDLTGRYASELAYLRRAAQDGALITAACTGALLLAEAGLLRGLEATIHWLYCERLASYPGVTVRAKQALAISADGRVVTAGGGTAFHDLCLYLIARFCGMEEAMRTARLALIDWHAAGQVPFAGAVAHRQSEDAVIARCQLWIAEHYDSATPVQGLLELTGLSERSLHRRFKAATGKTPIEYVHHMRIEEAKQMLETTNDSVESIAREVGYGDASFFGRLFRRAAGMTPAQYRKRYAGLRTNLQRSLDGDSARFPAALPARGR